MQTIQSAQALRPSRGPLVAGILVGAFLVVGGLALAWAAFATPLLTSLSPAGVRPGPEQMAAGALVWGMALVLPASFAIVGVVRLGTNAAALLRRPTPSALEQASAALGDEYVAAARVRLPEGRSVHNVILGPHGVAVVSELPPMAVTRRHGTSWEVRRADGRWVPFENPVERTGRDADSVRRWLNDDDRNFIVKVYATVVTDDPTLARTSACAVIGPHEIPAWLASLPPQRSLTADRREDLLELVRAAAD